MSFPVDVKSKLMDIIMSEGISEQNVPNLNGYNYFVTNILISTLCNDDNSIEFVYQLSDRRALNPYAYMYLRRGAPVLIPVNKMLRGEMSSDIKISPSNSVDVSGRGIIYKVAIEGYRFPLMTTGAEDRVIYCLGDSIDVLSAYVMKYAGHRNYQALEMVREAGYNARIASWAMSGNSMAQFVGYMKGGSGLIPKADIILVQHGANDIGQNVSNATFYSNMQYLKLWRDTNFKGAKLVIVKVAPSNESVAGGAARNAIQEGYNNQIDNFITANTNSNIYTIDVYNHIPKNGSVHADGVHLNQSGHDLMGPILGNGLKQILNL